MDIDTPKEFKFDYIEVALIKTYKRNVKLHPPKQIRQIRDSIRAFGFLVPVILDKDNELVAGHGRYEAVSGLPEYKRIPFVRAEHLTEAQIKAYRLADNKLAQTGFDIDALRLELQEIEIELIPLTGFEASDADAIHGDMAKFDNANCEYPLVAKYSEKYTGFLIVCENEIDETFLINALKIETEKSYKTKTVGRSFVIPFEKFKKLWEENKGIASK